MNSPGSLINIPILRPHMQLNKHLTEWASQARTHSTGEKASQMVSGFPDKGNHWEGKNPDRKMGSI